MITVRMEVEYERKIAQMARKAGMSSGPYVRRLLMAHVESHSDGKGDVTLDAKLNALQHDVAILLRATLQNRRSLKEFLDNAEVVDQ